MRTKTNRAMILGCSFLCFVVGALTISGRTRVDGAANIYRILGYGMVACGALMLIASLTRVIHALWLRMALLLFALLLSAGIYGATAQVWTSIASLIAIFLSIIAVLVLVFLPDPSAQLRHPRKGASQ